MGCSNVRTAEVDIRICYIICFNAIFRSLTDRSNEEWRLLSGLKPTIVTTSLVNMEEEARNGPYSFFLPNLNSSSDDGEVTAEFSQLGSLSPHAFSDQTLKTASVLQVWNTLCVRVID